MKVTERVEYMGLKDAQAELGLSDMEVLILAKCLIAHRKKLVDNTRI